MAIDGTAYWVLVAAVSFLKLLLLQSYRSTDFEVHRNWLAITHSKPLDEWYYEETSEWTLDYPVRGKFIKMAIKPLFAWFEWILSHVAYHFDKNMLVVTNLNHETIGTILFQKGSVIVVDLILAYAVSKLVCASCSVWMSYKIDETRMIYFVLIFFNGALFIVDHIHFQYNGFLFGILVLSIAKILEGRIVQGAILFATLLNLKHIYLYMAPAFGIYLFTKFCIDREKQRIIGLNFGNFCRLAFSVIAVFAIAFAPFYRHIPQILSRLFPFKRGLCHSYWAPNVWAIYSTADLALNYGLKRGKSSLASGLVGEKSMSVLPQVEPIHTFLLTLAFMMPCLVKIIRNPNNSSFIHGIILTSWTSFMFGYHVHEKAILNVLIPFAIIAPFEPTLFFMTLVTGTVSVFPLLFTPCEIIFKLIICVVHASITYIVMPKIKLSVVEKFYLAGFFPLYLIENFGPLVIPKYPFLPLVLVSDYCFVGLFAAYISFYHKCLKSQGYGERQSFFQMKKFD